MIQPGERFIYQRPDRYSGAGVIGPVTPSENASNSVCEILDYAPFDAPVPLRGPDDHYYEADPEASRFGVFWSQGVRKVSEGAYERMIAAGWSNGAPTLGDDIGAGRRHGHADAEEIAVISCRSSDSTICGTRASSWRRRPAPRPANSWPAPVTRPRAALLYQHAAEDRSGAIAAGMYALSGGQIGTATGTDGFGGNEKVR